MKYYLAEYSQDAKFLICEIEGKRYVTDLLYAKLINWHLDSLDQFSMNCHSFKSQPVSEKWLRLNNYPIYNPSISCEAY